MPYNPELHHPPSNNGRCFFNNNFLYETPEENPIFTDMKAVLIVMKITGLFPIYERVSHYEIAAPTKSNACYSFLVRGALHVINIIYTYVILAPDSMRWFYSNRDVDIGSKWIEIILSIIAISVTVFFCGQSSQNFLHIINGILKVDEELRKTFRIIPKNDCGFSGKFLIGIGAWQAYIIGSKILNASDEHTVASYFLVCVFVGQNCVVTAFIVFLAVLLRIIANRFACINLILMRYISNVQCKLAKDRIHNLNAFISMEKFPEHSLFLFRVHNRLLQIYKSLNECSNLIVVCFMGYSFYTITENTYNLFIETTTQRKLSSVIMIWGIAWLMLYISLLRLFCRNCGRASQEANKTKLILTRIYVNNKEHEKIINKFLIKSIKQKTEFTAYGFFVIDFSTLFKIFSAVTTYLVILIQFKQLEDSKIQDQVAAVTDN